MVWKIWNLTHLSFLTDTYSAKPSAEQKTGVVKKKRKSVIKSTGKGLSLPQNEWLSVISNSESCRDKWWMAALADIIAASQESAQLFNYWAPEGCSTIGKNHFFALFSQCIWPSSASDRAVLPPPPPTFVWSVSSLLLEHSGLQASSLFSFHPCCSFTPVWALAIKF